MAKILFYDTTDLDREQLTQGLQNTDHQWEYIPEKISLDNLDAEAEVISVFVTSSVSREMIEKMPKLRLIACRSTGFNNIDFAATEERDITVLNVPTYGEATVAEYAFTLLLSLMRKIPEVLSSENTQFNQTELLGNDLNGKTLGVIGTGHIGQNTIRIALGFGMHVVAYDPFPKSQLTKEMNFNYVALEELLAASDAISLHAPYNPATHHLIDKEKLGQMKPSAILINTARGELVNTKDLVEALTDGIVGGAALDVVEGEALLNHHEEVALLRSNNISSELLQHSVEISLLEKMPNVIISPHNAFNTVEAIGRINRTTAINIIDYWYGNTPHKVIAPKKAIGKLVVVRHAESEWNALGKWTGTTDVHLSEQGFHQSGQLGRLVKELQIPVDIAYCSQHIRSRETLEGILDAAQLFDIDIVREKAINERDYGDYTGKNKWEMKDVLGEEKFMAVRRGWDEPIPNGESLKDVYARAVPFYTDIILPILLSGSNVMIVAHGNSIRALMKYLETISDDAIGELEMLLGQVVVYTISDKGLMNDKLVVQLDDIVSKA